MPFAARVGDPTSDGGVVVPPGVPTVLIGGLPAAVLGQTTLCPVQPPPPAVPHGSAPIIAGSSTVLVGGRPAARAGDRTACGAVLTQGCPTVLVGG